MAENDARVTGTDGPGGQDKIALAKTQELGTHQSGYPHPSGQANDDHDVPDRRIEEGDNRKDQEEGREAQHDIDKTHQQGIDPASVVAGQGAEDDADQGGDANGDEADEET